MRWVSAQYPSEVLLQNDIEAKLKLFDVRYIREPKDYNARTRPDFRIGNPYTIQSIFIEAKIDTKSTAMDRAIGQCLRNAVNGLRKTWVVVPDDVGLAKEPIYALNAIGSEVIRISSLGERLGGFRVADKANRDFRFLNQDEAAVAAMVDQSVLHPRISMLSDTPLYYQVRRRINQIEEIEKPLLDEAKERGLEVAA